MSFPLDRDEFRAVSVLSSDYDAFDIADHLADVMPEATVQGSIWAMSALDLALLAVDNYPGGAMGLQLTLMGYEEPLCAAVS